MFSFLKKLLGGSDANLRELIKNGAKIIDVRTKSEYQSGHVKGSVNIPLDSLPSKVNTLRKDDTFVMCCRSGSRSASAVRFLKSSGFTKVYNGGSWYNLKNM